MIRCITVSTQEIGKQVTALQSKRKSQTAEREVTYQEERNWVKQQLLGRCSSYLVRDKIIF